ncbi:hypothetical protein B9Z19DRAFT_1141958 [Tuber borchii]|uniref:Uncharacterized protein n=1 Tax=Tuber borchii TaxID=42251 RepID=A0A2T6ZSX0_TUBBO|nr:hypothetical protein B9Z19DRAFT_1141958 [Tuber borchii]
MNNDTAKNHITTLPTMSSVYSSAMFLTRSSNGNLGPIHEHPHGAHYAQTPGCSPNPNEAASMVPTSPSTGDSSMLPQYPCIEEDAQALGLEQNSHEISGISDLAAQGDSSQTYSMNDFLSQQELLRQQDSKWFQRYQDQAKELQAKFFLRSQECQAEWYERFLYGKTDKMIFEENFNLCGALVTERMVYHAKLLKKIGADWALGIQSGLDEISKAPAFTKLLHEQAAARGLVPKDIIPCIAFVYDKAYKHGARGNDSIITLCKDDYTVKELAVLATFLRLQSEWPHGLEWREERRRRQPRN